MNRLDKDPEMQFLLGYSVPASVSVPKEFSPSGPAMVAGGAYEGASLFDNELALWRPSFGSADSDILPDKPYLDARTRDVARNDAFIKSGIRIHQDSVVGSQYRLNSKPNWQVLGLDEAWAEEFQIEFESKFTLWAESLSNYPDASGHMGLTAMVRLAVGAELMAGEVLAVAEWIEDDPSRPFKTAIQMIDTDRLGDPASIMPYAKERLRGGVLHNRRGKPLGYFIRRTHPNDPDTILNPGADNYRYVRAKKPWGRQQVIHIYETMRPEQSRGVSTLVAALKEMRMTKNFREVMLQNAVINATYAASIESELPTEAVYQQMGAGDADLTAAITGYAGAYLTALQSYTGTGRTAWLNGARIPHFFPGTKLQLRPAGAGGPLGTEFETSLLRYLAADLDLSYEQLSRDLSQTNYSGLKATLGETHKGMRSRKKLTADRFATHIAALWLEEAIATGEITSLPRNAPNFWEGLNKEAYTACDWIGGSRGQIDELKETQAAVLRLKYNLSTDEAELARLGEDWREVYRQRAREKKLRKELEILTAEEQATEDNMMNAVTGAPRQKEAKGEKDDGSEDNTDANGTIGKDFLDAVEEAEEERPTRKPK